MVTRTPRHPARLFPKTKHYRQRSVKSVLRYLDAAGIPTSRRSVLRYAELLDIGYVRAKRQFERIFTQEDLVRLHCVALLKRLGYTSRQIQVWLGRPEGDSVKIRIRKLEILRTQAEELVQQLQGNGSATSP